MQTAFRNELRLGFGLGRLHHVWSRQRRERIVMRAIDAGFSHLDVAPAYGDGLCESEVGRILGARRHAVSIASKFGISCSNWGARNEPLYYARKVAGSLFSSTYGMEYTFRDFSASTAVASLEASLRRLRSDYIDYFFVHEPLGLDDLTAAGGLVDALEDQKRKGKILHYGIAAPTALLIEAQRARLEIGDATQFELSSRSTELLADPQRKHSWFSYGIVRHLSGGDSNRRIEPVESLRWFFSNFPAAVPIMATNREDELSRLERAILALR